MKKMMKLENGINELKGNLFEYLLGATLARHYKVEDRFLHSLEPYARQQLMTYEILLRQEDPDLFKTLPALAQSVAETLIPRIPENLQQIFLVGKWIKSPEGPLAEADILLQTPGETIPLSLKLCKNNSFVNTKNAGVQSFLKKYFAPFHSERDQLELDRFLHESFSRMGHELYQLADLAELGFNGQFDQRWTAGGFSDLPGELPPEMRDVLYRYYFQVIEKIFLSLKNYLERDPVEFLKSLFPLCGFTHSGIWQLICFHGEGREREKEKGQRYRLKGVQLLTFQEMRNNIELIRLAPLKEGLSSFEIHLKDSILQIRVKPMNKFTTPGMKVNCSVKFHSRAGGP